jgi:hypothetical protein
MFTIVTFNATVVSQLNDNTQYNVQESVSMFCSRKLVQKRPIRPRDHVAVVEHLSTAHTGVQTWSHTPRRKKAALASIARVPTREYYGLCETVSSSGSASA